MILLRLLEWDWMFSYGAGNCLVLDENTLTQILGVNGMGKSSIPLIIEELMYNKNSKGIKKGDIPNRYGPGGYKGRLTFDKDEDTYVIEVERKASLKVKLTKNGEDISSHTATNTYKTLEALYGNDFKTNSQLIYQSPFSSLTFLTATDTSRKKFLMELLRLDEYVEKFEQFKGHVKEHTTSVLALEAQVNTVQKWLDSNKLENIETLEPKVLDIDLFEDEKKAAGLGAELANIKSTNAKISKNNQYRELLAAINIEEVQAIECEELKSYDEEQTELGGLNAHRKTHEAQLKKLQALGDSCPTCEQDIDPQFKQQLIKAEEDEIKTIASRVLELKQIIADIQENNLKYKNKQEQIKSWEELFRSIDNSLPTKTIDKEALEAELSNITIKIANARNELKKITEHNENVAKHNSRVQVILEQSEKFQKELSEVDAKLEEEKEVLASLELIKKSFSTNGVIAYKIENLVKDLEDLANTYLAELSDGRFTIEFSVVSDKLNVNITDHGTLVDILALSSGELARVNTSTLLALRKLMNSMSKSKINVLFLDEVMNVLDDDGRETLVNVLIKEDLNTYIVSHGWSHPLLTKLKVVKDDDQISRIEEADDWVESNG